MAGISFSEKPVRSRKGILKLASSWIDMQATKFEAMASGYNHSRQMLETGEDLSSIPESEASRQDHDLPDLMARSDHQWRNNGVYSGMLTRAVDNIIGSGIPVSPNTTDRDYNRAVAIDFDEWMRDVDVYGPHGMDGYTQQRVACLDCFRGGNSLLYESDMGFQLFEPQQVGTPLGYRSDLRKIQSGVELDHAGRAARYWVGPFTAWGYIDLNSAVGLRADKCLLIGNREYASGYRSVPPLASQIERFVHLDKYLEAELFGARMASNIVATVNSDDKNVLDAFKSALKNTADVSNTNSVPPLSKRVKMAPGSVINLLEKEKFQLHSINRPGNGFRDYLRIMMRFCGAKIAMPLELALLDFSESNFSSSKMLALQCMMTWGQWQGLVMAPMVRRQYFRYLSLNRVKPKRGVKDLTRFDLDFPKPAWVDQLKESLGRQVGVDTGWNSNTGVAREMGKVIEDVIQDRASEYKAAVDAVVAAGYKQGTEEFKVCLSHVLGNFGNFRRDLVKAGYLDEAA